MHYTYKVWIAEGKEHFEYGGGQKKRKDFPFAESLMELLYCDIWSLGELFESMGKALVRLYETKEQRYADEMLSTLDVIAKKHIFFEQMRLDWQERLAKMMVCSRSTAVSTKNALAGLRLGKLSRAFSMHGAKKPKCDKGEISLQEFE